MRKSAAILIVLIACFAVAPVVSGMAMRVPPSLENTIRLDLGDTYDAQVTAVGDAQTNDVTFFVDMKDPDLLVVEGTRGLYEDEFVLDPQEVRDFSVEFEVIGQNERDTDAVATIGFKFTEADASGGGIGIEQVISKDIIFDIDGAGVPREESSEGASSSGGGIATAVGAPQEQDSPEEEDGDTSLEDTSPQGTSFNTAIVDTRSTGNRGSASEPSVSVTEGKMSAISLLVLLFVTMMINVVAIQYVRKRE